MLLRRQTIHLKSVQAFENAVSDAKTVAAGNPSTEEIQAAMDAIASAQSALVEKQPEEVAETDIVEEEGPNFLLIGVLQHSPCDYSCGDYYCSGIKEWQEEKCRGYSAGTDTGADTAAASGQGSE